LIGGRGVAAFWRLWLCRRCIVAALTLAAFAALAGWAARADAALTWSAPATIDPGNSLLSVACVQGSSLCVAADSFGNVVTSTDPTAGAWTEAGADTSGQNGFYGVSCASARFCVAVDSGGNVVTSTDPTGGAGAWTVTPVDSGNTLTAVSCVSANFCVAVDSGGDVVTSTSPASSAWSVTPVDPNVALLNVSCASTNLCVAVDAAGDILSATVPMGGTSAWTVDPPTGVDGPIDSVSCPSSSLCVAADESGDVLTSTDPAAASPTWSVASVDGDNAIDGVSCVTGTSSCEAVDNAGNVLSSSDPAGGASAWSLAQVAANDVLNAVSCATTSLCVAVDVNGAELYGAPPQSPGSPPPPAGGGSTSVPGTAYTLSVHVAGSGKGTVSFSGLGVDCASACEGTGSGAYVGTATAASGSVFAGWSGRCEGTGACDLTLDGDESVTATFEAIPKSPSIRRARISGTTAAFTLAKPAAASALQCALVRRPSGKRAKSKAPTYSRCAASVTYRRLKKGEYVFYARSVAGGAHSKAVAHGFKVT
jgi:hypothetical protein